MTTAIVGPSQSGNGVAIGQEVLFPSHFPFKFTLNAAHYLAFGNYATKDEIDNSLLPFTAFSRLHSADGFWPLANDGGADQQQAYKADHVFGHSTSGTVIISLRYRVARSTDFGKTFGSAGGSFPGSGVGDSSIYSITTDNAGNWLAFNANNQLMRSTNDGQSFVEVGGVFTDSLRSDKIVSCGNGVWLLLSNTANQIRRSADDGASWSDVPVNNFGLAAKRSLINNGGAVVLAFAPVSNVSGTPIGMWRSTDSGQTWSGPTWDDGSAVTAGTIPTKAAFTPSKHNFCFLPDASIIYLKKKYRSSSVIGAYTLQFARSSNLGASFVEMTDITSASSSYGNLGNGVINRRCAEALVYLGDNKLLCRTVEVDDQAGQTGSSLELGIVLEPDTNQYSRTPANRFGNGFTSLNLAVNSTELAEGSSEAYLAYAFDATTRELLSFATINRVSSTNVVFDVTTEVFGSAFPAYFNGGVGYITGRYYTRIK